MANVYISYSPRDQDFVRALQNALAQRGRTAWVDYNEILPAADWLEESYSGIDEADAFVFPGSSGGEKGQVILVPK